MIWRALLRARNLVLPLDPATHTGDRVRHVSKLGQWGVGGLEVRIDGEEDLERALA